MRFIERMLGHPRSVFGVEHERSVWVQATNKRIKSSVQEIHGRKTLFKLTDEVRTPKKAAEKLYPKCTHDLAKLPCSPFWPGIKSITYMLSTDLSSSIPTSSTMFSVT